MLSSIEAQQSATCPRPVSGAERFPAAAWTRKTACRLPRCRVEALKWVDVQRDQFLRLGIQGDWQNPYLTLDPGYEAAILDVLADLVAGGYVFRQLKPIHWCMNDRTALAEAERGLAASSSNARS